VSVIIGIRKMLDKDFGTWTELKEQIKKE